MTRAGALLAAAVLVGSCSAGDTTTTTAPPVTVSTTTTTTSTDPTTTVSAAPIDICSVGKVWDVGASYTASCFLLPLIFTPSAPGWRSSGAAERWVSLRWVEPDEREWEVDVGIIAYQPNNDPGEAIEAIDSLRGIDVLGDPEPINLARMDGITVDAEGEPPRTPGVDSADDCDGGLIRFSGAQGGDGGNPIVEGIGRDEIGVGYCVVARLWTLDINGQTITVLAAASDPQRHDDAVAIVEGLLESMTVSSS